MTNHSKTPAPPPTDPNQSNIAQHWKRVKEKLQAIEFNWRPFSIYDELPLHKHMVFWWPILFFVGWALLLTVPYWCFCWPSPTDYEALLKQLGFPIFVASLCLPISVAVGRFHASKQRAKANTLTVENNAFNNYFAHRNHFMEHIGNAGIPKEYEGFIEVYDSDKLYKTVFPQNSLSEQNFRINKFTYKAQLRRKLKSLYGHINTFVIEVEEGEVERDHEEFEAFARTIPHAFGFRFSDGFAKFYGDYAKRTNFTFFSLCFLAIKYTLLSVHAFNHIQTVGWLIETEFEPYLTSLEENEALINADAKAMEYMVWLLTEDKSR